MSRLTRNTSVSDGLAQTLGDIHASTIALARATLTTDDNIPIRDQIVQRHTRALIELGRLRVADDLRANGWIINAQDEWQRRIRPDEWPFKAEPLNGPNPEYYVLAENNHHARMIDGTCADPYVRYDEEHYVV